MKNNIYILIMVTLLTGCFGPAKFDASSETSIKESSKKIVDDLPLKQKEEFRKALMYFTIGGEDGFASIFSSAFSGNADDINNNSIMDDNLQAINGLTGDQILVKYKTEKAERVKVNSLREEAEKLLANNMFEEALEKYNNMSAIPSGVGIAGNGIKKTSKLMKEFTEKMNYVDKILITEFIATRIDTYVNKDVPSVRISLKNTGDRSLDKVKVAVYFQDKNGDTIFEETFLPVLVSKYSFSRDNKPLKPGYVKEMGKGKYFTIDSALSDWQEGKAIAKIVDIEFTN